MTKTIAMMTKKSLANEPGTNTRTTTNGAKETGTTWDNVFWISFLNFVDKKIESFLALLSVKRPYKKVWMVYCSLIKHLSKAHCNKYNWPIGHSSVDLSATSILPPRVRVPSTRSTFLSIYIWIGSCGKDENNKKRPG